MQKDRNLRSSELVNFGAIQSSEVHQVSSPEAIKAGLEAAFNRKPKGMSREVQLRIDELENKKLAVLLELKNDLVELAKNPKYEKKYLGGRSVKYDEMTNCFVLANSRNESLTQGEILTDGEWGVVYNLDASVDRETRQQYLIETAKRELRRLLDEQISAEKLGNAYTDRGLFKAYSARDQEPEEIHAGLIAEKLVRNLLKKLFIDSGVGYSVEEANLLQDVEHKMDFIIHRPMRSRGVGVKALRGITDIGVQFTLNESQKNVEHKQHQIQKAKERLGNGGTILEIVLVSLPMRNVIELVKNWRKELKPGGPDKLWGKDKKEAIVREVLYKLFSQQEINEICQGL